ncbi:MAG TPA: DUF5518 domain-containing protein [Mucilaginibacter sp.]
MERLVKKLLITLLAVVVSILSYYFVTGWYNVITWAIAALVVGYMSENRRNSIINGFLFGYFLFLVYILLGYNGKIDTSSMVKFILFDVFFSLIGSVACIVGAIVGNLFKRK